MTSKKLTPEEIVDSFKKEFITKVSDTRINKFTNGLKKTDMNHIWMKIDPTIIKDVTKHIMTLEKYPHFAVSSGYDTEKTIDIVYHFSIYYGKRGEEISINLITSLPKTKPEIDTISDLIPGALIAEQEKQEMLGIKVKNIPQDRRSFISDDFPKDVYPWRKDETGPKKMVRNLHEVKK